MSTGYKTDELYAAFKEPILRHLKWELWTVLQETGDDAIAEDLSSELWLRVLKHEGRFENSGSVKSWLYTIADNLMKDYLRDEFIRAVDEDGCVKWRKRRERLDHLLKSDRKILGNAGAEKDPEDEADCPPFQPRDSRPSPQEWLLASEQDEFVDGVLRQIDAPSRAVLEYRLQGLSLTEIAEKTNTPLSAVKSRLYRGRARLLEMTETPIRCGSIECRPEKWVFTW